MDISQFSNPYLIGLIMAFMIGPVFFMLLKTSVLKGVTSAIIFDLGVLFSDVIFILMAYYGSKSLLEKLQDDPRLIIAGGAILIIYGLVTFFTAKNEKDNGSEVKISKTRSYFRLFRNGFLLNFINVGVLTSWLGIMVIVAPNLGMNPSKIFWFFAKILIGYLVVDLGKILLAKQLQKKMTPDIIYKMKKGMGIFLILFGLVMILKSFVF